MSTEMMDPVETASKDELDDAIAQTLSGLGISRAELQAQAVAGRFDSEAARRAWFLVSSLEQIA